VVPILTEDQFEDVALDVRAIHQTAYEMSRIFLPGRILTPFIRPMFPPDQVRHVEAIRAVLERDLDDEAQIGLDESVGRPYPAVGTCARAAALSSTVRSATRLTSLRYWSSAPNTFAAIL
jgi:hypothetical protein